MTKREQEIVRANCFHFPTQTSARLTSFCLCIHAFPEVGKDDGLFDVLLVNEKDHVTECSIANIAFEVKGEGDQAPQSTRWITPPESDGLLPGVLRQDLIASGHLSEQTVSLDQLRSILKVPANTLNNPTQTLCF